MKFWSWYTLYMTYTLIEYVEDVLSTIGFAKLLINSRLGEDKH